MKYAENNSTLSCKEPGLDKPLIHSRPLTWKWQHLPGWCDNEKKMDLAQSQAHS